MSEGGPNKSEGLENLLKGISGGALIRDLKVNISLRLYSLHCLQWRADGFLSAGVPEESLFNQAFN